MPSREPPFITPTTTRAPYSAILRQSPRRLARTRTFLPAREPSSGRQRSLYEIRTPRSHVSKRYSAFAKLLGARVTKRSPACSASSGSASSRRRPSAAARRRTRRTSLRNLRLREATSSSHGLTSMIGQLDCQTFSFVSLPQCCSQVVVTNHQ